MIPNSYRYVANNAGSYTALATYLIPLDANVTLFPGQRTLVVSADSAELIKSIGSFIDSEGLDFHVTPVEPEAESISDLISDATADPNTLRYAIGKLNDIIAQKEAELEIEKANVKRLEEVDHATGLTINRNVSVINTQRKILEGVRTLLTPAIENGIDNVPQLEALASYIDAATRYL